MSQRIWTPCLKLNAGVYEGLQEEIGDDEFLECWSVHDISQLMKDPKIVAIDYAILPLIGNIFYDLVTNLIPRVVYACPSDAIFIFYGMFIVLEEVYLGSLSNLFFIFTPR